MVFHLGDHTVTQLQLVDKSPGAMAATDEMNRLAKDGRIFEAHSQRLEEGCRNVKALADAVKATPGSTQQLSKTIAELESHARFLSIAGLLKKARYDAQALSLPELDSRLRSQHKKDFVHNVSHVKFYLGQFEDDVRAFYEQPTLHSSMRMKHAVGHMLRVAEALKAEASTLPDDMPTPEEVEAARAGKPGYVQKLPAYVADLLNLTDDIVMHFRDELAMWEQTPLSTGSEAEEQKAQAELLALFQHAGIDSLKPGTIVKRPTWTEADLAEAVGSTSASASQASEESSSARRKKKNKRRELKPSTEATSASASASADAEPAAPAYDDAYRDRIRLQARGAIKRANNAVLQVQRGLKDCYVMPSRNENWLNGKFAEAEEALKSSRDLLAREEVQLDNALSQSAEGAEKPSAAERLQLSSAKHTVLSRMVTAETSLKKLAEEKSRLQVELMERKPLVGLYLDCVGETDVFTTECSLYGQLKHDPEYGNYLLDVYPINDDQGQIGEGHTHRDPETGKIRACHIKFPDPSPEERLAATAPAEAQGTPAEPSVHRSGRTVMERLTYRSHPRTEAQMLELATTLKAQSVKSGKGERIPKQERDTVLESDPRSRGGRQRAAQRTRGPRIGTSVPLHDLVRD